MRFIHEKDQVTDLDVRRASQPLGTLLKAGNVLGAPTLPERVDERTERIFGAAQLRPTERHSWKDIGGIDSVCQCRIEEVRRRQWTAILDIGGIPSQRPSIDNAGGNLDDSTEALVLDITMAEAGDSLLDDANDSFPCTSLVRRMRRNEMPINSLRSRGLLILLPLRQHLAKQVVSADEVRSTVAVEALERRVERVESL